MFKPAAFDPVTRVWVPSGTPGAVPVPALRGGLVGDEASMRWAAEDFGHVVHHRPRAVLRPGAVSDVAAMVAFAGAVGLPVAARGAGHSTYGQAQTSGGIVVDMARLDQVGEVGDGQVTAQGGALWSSVLDAALAHGRTPPALTDYLQTTVGGTLAVGGVGGASHQYGLQVDMVLELEVVTGTGALVTCSPQHNRELFDAVRAGLGQCGIITRATLRLVPAPTHVRYYRLYYRKLAPLLEDQRQLLIRGNVDYLEGQLVPPGRLTDAPEPGAWHYLLEAAVYHAPPTAPDDAAVLAGLHHAIDEIEDLPYREFAHRMAPGEAALRASGEWLYPHAWLTLFLPADATAAVVSAVLANLTASDLGRSGLALLYPLRTDRFHAPLTRVPDTELIWLFALLRTASTDDSTAITAMINANRTVHDHALAHGAVAYPINTMAPAQVDWGTHFGSRWGELLTAKAEFDPHAILSPGYGIGPVNATRTRPHIAGAGPRDELLRATNFMDEVEQGSDPLL